MKMMKILLFTALVFGLSACCLKTIEIEPQMTNVDLRTLTIDSVYAKIKFELKECCPTKSQKETVKFLEAQTRHLYVMLLNNQITLTQYNAKIDASTRAIENVVLYCNKNDEKKIEVPLDSTNTKIKSKRLNLMDSDEAWKILDSVAQGL